MSRSGYTDDCDDNWVHIKWRGQVASAIRGKRGQAFLRELVEAMDAMPVKRLISNALIQDFIAIDAAGQVKPVEPNVCALGVVGLRRGIALERLDPENYDDIAEIFGITHQLVRELEWVNDEASFGPESPEERWRRVRCWAVSRLKDEPASRRGSQ